MRYAICCVILAAVLSSGCKTTRRQPPPIPDDLHEMHRAALADARACIESKGTRISVVKPVGVKKVPGTKKFGRCWGWYSKEWGQYILGLYDGKYVYVGVNPQTGGEADYGTMKHECGHHWLVTNYGWNHYPQSACGHDPKYKSCFDNWRIVTVQSMALGAEPVSVITTDSSGNSVHITFAPKQ